MEPKDFTPISFGLKDSLYGHAEAASNGNLGISPKYINFDRSLGSHEVTFFTDLDLDKAVLDKSKMKVAWLIESPEVHKASYSYIQNPSVYKLFDIVLTFDNRLLNLDDRFVLTPVGGCWIPEVRRQVYPKDNNLSIITSRKADLYGQMLRQQVVERYSNKIDGVFGRGYKELEDKTDGLKNFRYSLVLENCRTDYYFTEKIIDCFATGTIPIYWGCPSIGQFFDTEGVIPFQSINELDDILASLNTADYDRRLPAIRSNFARFSNFAVTEDYIYNEVVLKHPAFKPYLA